MLEEEGYRPDYADEAWGAIKPALYRLSQDQPSGDDAVFDYWPNALQTITLLYEVGVMQEFKWASQIDLATRQERYVLPSYYLHHVEESCGHDVARMVAQAFIKLGWFIGTYPDTIGTDSVSYGIPEDRMAIE